MTADALRDVAEWQKVEDGPFTWMLYAYVHGRAGHKTEAQSFCQLEAERSRRYVDAAKLVIAYLGVGDNEQALKWFEKASLERPPHWFGLESTLSMIRCARSRDFMSC